MRKIIGVAPATFERLEELLARRSEVAPDTTKSAIAREALDRIGALYDVEREINGRPADIRLVARQRHSAPKVEAFFAWSEQQLSLIPGKSDLAKAVHYGLSRQAAFRLFLEDCRVALAATPAILRE